MVMYHVINLFKKYVVERTLAVPKRHVTTGHELQNTYVGIWLKS
jgi:hypothetical protein